jgi:HAMP domain-containing protein
VTDVSAPVAPDVSDPSQDWSETIRIDGEDVAASDLPWWRRPRKLRRQLIGALVFVAFASVVLVGALNLVAARRLLDDGTKEQLASIGAARARSIERGIERTESQASAAAADLAVVQALEDLSAAFTTRSTGRIDDAQLAELDEFYEQTVVDPVEAAGLGPVAVDELRPESEAGRYVQYHYTVPEADDPEARRAVVDAGDGSAYSEAHADHHPQLASLSELLGFGDLLLVSAEGDVVYSTDKRVDLGTSLVDGPYSDTELARTVRERLPLVRIGQGVLADIELYLPDEGSPVFFVAASVRRDQEVIGALVLEIPVEALSRVTTADQQWEEVGLQEGESYVVGSDLLLRSESRPWIEDPQGYLDRVDDPELAELIETFGSPIALQPVDTEPVSEAVSGRTFEGTASNYLGQSTYSFATPIDAPGVDWVVVADVPLSDARSPLFDYATRLGIVLLVILPLAGAVGYIMAGRLTRPIPPVMRAAREVAAGDRDPDLPELGQDEFGDLSRRLGAMAKQLGRHETELAEAYEERRQLLLAVLPPHIIEDDGEPMGSDQIADLVTMVAVRVNVVGDNTQAAEDEIAELLGDAARVAETLAEDRGMDRIRAGADSYLFLAGAGAGDGDGADTALGFATDLVNDVSAVSDGEEFDLSVHVGLSTGPAATGVLEQGNLTFTAWGEPVRRSLAIGAFAASDEILVDRSTADSASADRWDLRAAEDVVDLDGQPMDLSSLRGSR